MVDWKVGNYDSLGKLLVIWDNNLTEVLDKVLQGGFKLTSLKIFNCNKIGQIPSEIHNKIVPSLFNALLNKM